MQETQQSLYVRMGTLSTRRKILVLAEKTELGMTIKFSQPVFYQVERILCFITLQLMMGFIAS